MERLERLELAALLLIEHGQTEAFFCLQNRKASNKADRANFIGDN